MSTTAFNAAPGPEQGVALQGRVMGGQAPLEGAHLYLLEASTNGIAGPGIADSIFTPSQSLLTSSGSNTTEDMSTGPTGGFYYVTSDTSGNWYITGDYTCTGGDQVYLYSLGGGEGTTSYSNSAAGMLAALGTCPGTAGSTGNSFSSGLFIVVNEVSTVAAAYAFAGFATDALNVGGGSVAQGQLGLMNAFANAANLETLSGTNAGTVPATTAGGGTVPQAEIYTLADILAACVNTTGTISSGPPATPCYTLFTNALSGGTTGTQPTDTATAAINIAHNPGANIAALFALSTASPPFVGLGTAPNDFTIALNFSGGGISSPDAIAIDYNGDAWIVNNGSTASVTELSPLGVALNSSPFTVGGLQSPSGIAIDLNGNAWISNDYSPGSITELTSTGTNATGSPFTGGGLNEPRGIAVDGSNNICVANYGGGMSGSVSEFTNGGTAVSSSSGIGPGIGVANQAIVVDDVGNVWTINGYLTSAEKFIFNHTTGAYGSAPNYQEGMNDPTALAIDSNNYVWVATHGSYVEVLSDLGTVKGHYTGGGIEYSQGIAIDGQSNAWIVNTSFTPPDQGLLSEFSSYANGGTAITTSNGYTSSSMLAPTAIAVDNAGNVWVTNSGNSTVSEFIGAASPVVTPLALGSENGTLGEVP